MYTYQKSTKCIFFTANVKIINSYSSWIPTVWKVDSYKLITRHNFKFSNPFIFAT